MVADRIMDVVKNYEKVSIFRDLFLYDFHFYIYMPMNDVQFFPASE